MWNKIQITWAVLLGFCGHILTLEKKPQKMKTQTLKFSHKLFLDFPENKKIGCHQILESKVTLGPAEATELLRKEHLKVSPLNKHTNHKHGVFLKD